MLYQTNQAPLAVSRRNSFDFVPHAHHVMEVLICAKGPFEVSCNFRTEVLQTGDVMIAFSNDIHAYTKTEGGEGIMIMVDPSLFRHTVTVEKVKRYDNFLLGGDEALVALGKDLLREYRTDGSMTVMMGYFYVILGKILKELEEAGVVGPEEGTKPRKVLMSMEAFEQYVDEYV